MTAFGVWRARGYGWLLEVGSAGYALFDYTDLSCIEFERGSLVEFQRAFDRVEIDRDSMNLHVRGDITRYWFDRAVLPERVLRLDDARVYDPVFNFDVLWRVFYQDYAFFERHRIDWHETYRRFRARIDAETGAEELRGVFEAMLRELRDNHVYLQTPGTMFVSDRIADIKSWMVQAFELDSPSLGDAKTIARYQAFVAQDILRGQARSAGNNLVSWGYVAPRVAYLAVLRLFGFASTPQARAAVGLPRRRNEVADFLEQDLAAVEGILDRVMSDLVGADALVLDIRVNGGGFDRIGMAIANRFTDRRRLAFTKRARVGSTLGAAQPQYIEPTGATFTRPVYLLTAQRTASAGEILALCMMALPHVTRLGQPTLGIFSDDLAKHLPNGWTTSLSNEVYAAPDGTIYEGDGVPPDVTVPVFMPGDFRGALKLAVEAAVRIANGAP